MRKQADKHPPRAGAAPPRRRRWLPVLLCYAGVLLVWLGLCGFRLLRDTYRLSHGQISPTPLALEDFTYVDGLRPMEGWDEHHNFVTTDDDPQLVLDFPQGAYVNRFAFSGRPVSKGGGAMNLYYTTQPGQPISEGRKLWAQRAADGTWYFDLQGLRVYTLRFDVGSRGGVVWHYGGAILNAEKPPISYFTPSTRQIALLLLGPLLVWAIWGEIAAFFQPVIIRRRFEKRWQSDKSKIKRR